MDSERTKYPAEGYYSTSQRAEQVAIQLCTNNAPLTYVVYHHRGHGYYVRARGVAPEEYGNALTAHRLVRSDASPGAITGIRKAETPCADCIDGWCQMNCGPSAGGAR